MEHRELNEGAASQTAPQRAPLQPVVSRGVTTGQLRQANGRFGGKAVKIEGDLVLTEAGRRKLSTLELDDSLREAIETPWSRPESFRPETSDAVTELRAKIRRRQKLHRFIRNACIALGIFIVCYMAAQFLRLAV